MAFYVFIFRMFTSPWSHKYHTLDMVFFLENVKKRGEQNNLLYMYKAERTEKKHPILLHLTSKIYFYLSFETISINTTEMLV